jgi:Skp family chaperone for outer membrane proteins
MKRTNLLICIAVATAAVAVVWARLEAQQPPAADPARPTAVAICDVVSVYNNYDRARDLTEEFNRRREEMERQAAQRAQRIEQLSDVLSGLKVGSKTYEEKVQEMMKLRMEGEAWASLKQRMAEREHRQLTQEMYEEIVAVISAVARQRGYDLVLHRDTIPLESRSSGELLNKIAQRKVLYARKAVDITDVVLELVNRRYQQSKKDG